MTAGKRCSGNEWFSQTLLQHDLFSQGLWGRRKLWNLLLAHLTPSASIIMLIIQLHGSLVKWVRASVSHLSQLWVPGISRA